MGISRFIKNFITTLGTLFNQNISKVLLKEQSGIDLFKDLAMKRSSETFYKHMSQSTVLTNLPDFHKWCIEYTLKNPIKNSDKSIYAEFGVWKGKSINRFAKLINKKIIFGFDSFEGIEEDWRINNLKKHFTTNKVVPKCESNVELVVGKVQDTLIDFLNKHDGDFQFLHLDMDTYIPTNFVLKEIKHKLKKNTVILFDELHGYESWEAHEYKALIENLSEDEYEFIGFCHLQAAIVIKKDI